MGAKIQGSGDPAVVVTSADFLPADNSLPPLPIE